MPPIHVLLLPPTLILISITLFIIFYYPTTIHNTIHTQTDFLLQEFSSDIEKKIITQLEQSIPPNTSQKNSIQNQIYTKLFYIFVISTIIMFALSNKSPYSFHHINQTLVISFSIIATLYLTSRFVIEKTIFTDPNVIRQLILQIAIDKFKNQPIDINDVLQDLLPSEINELLNKVQTLKTQLPNALITPKNVVIPPTPQKLIIP